MKRIYIALLTVLFVAPAFSQPANDNCNTAELVNPNGSCYNGTTVGAGDSWTGTVGCQSGNNHPEVWYTFVATGTSLSVNLTAGTITGNLEFVLVQATGPCANLVIVGSLCGGAPINGTINGLTVGNTYYFTISTSGSQGTFNVCVNNTSPPTVPGQDCSSSAILCNSNPFSQGTFSGIGTFENVDLNSCFGGNERQSKWYKFTAGCSGTFEFNIDPNINIEDFDWAIWNTTTGCYSVGATMGVPLACNWSGCPGNTGISTNPCSVINFDCLGNPNDCNSPQINTTALNLVAGQTYTLLIDNFTSSGGGFSVSFGGTATMGPDANFTYSAGACGTYTFTKFCQTTNSTFLWQFGDGQTSTDQNPVHTYSTFGNFMITLQVTDALGCIETSSQTINIVATPPPVVTTPVTYCVGATASPLTATGTSLLWYTAATGGTGSTTAPTPSTAAPGATSYWVTQTVAGCESPRVQIVVTVNPSPTVTVNSPTICAGQSTTLTATPFPGGGTYSWSPGGATTPSITVSPGTTTPYTVTYTFAGCSKTGTGTVTVNPVPTVTVNSPSICVGQSTTLTATPSTGGGTYSWSPGGATTQTINVTPGTTTPYTVTYTLAGCSNTGTGTVTVNPVPTVTVNSPSICVGQSTTLTATPSTGGGTYSWSPGGATIQTINVTPGTTTPYTVTYTLAGCSNTGSGTVTVNPVPTVAVNSPSICVGQSTTLTATPSTGGGTFSWSPGGATTQTINVTLGTTTSYTVTYTLAGCSNTGSGTVTVNPVPTVTINSPSICVGQSTTLTATPSTGGGTFSWSPGGATTQTINVSPGTTTPYTVTYTLAGCSNTGTGTVTVNAVPTVTVNSPSICVGQSTTLTATPSAGGGTYSWSPGGATTQTINVTPGTTTPYTVTYTLAGCSNTGTGTVTVNPVPTVTVNSPSICVGQSTTLTATPSTGGGTYSWSPGGSTTQTINVTPSTTTPYTVTYTLAGCSNTGTGTVTVNAVPTVTVNSPSICVGQSTTLTATPSTGGGTFSWSPGGATTQTINVTPGGTTPYTVTYTLAGCSNTGTGTVTVNPVPTVTVNSPSICVGQSTTLTATPSTGGGTYSWSPGGATTQTINITPGTTTPYTVTYTLAGCSNTGTGTVTVNAVPTVTVNSSTICIGQSTTLTATPSAGGGTYSWSPGGATTQTINITPGTTTPYTVTYTLAGCSNTGTGTVTVNAVPTVTVNSPSICIGQSTTLTATPSTGGGTYSWSPGGATTQTINVTPGTTTPYTVTYTLAGCSNTGTGTVTVNPVPTVTVNSSSICVGQSTTLTATPSIGGGTYLWSPGGAATQSITVSPGTTAIYNVTYTLAGCSNSGSGTVTVGSISTSTTSITICSNQLPYSWNSQTYNAAGTYSVTLTSASGCDSVATLNLAVNPILSSTTNVTICSNQLPYSWNSQSYNAAGAYSVTLTSSNGCDSVATLNLAVNPILSSTTNVTVCSNQLPFSWNSQSYNAAGTYSVALTSASGCDSVATLNLAVNPTKTSTTNVTICSNQLPYSWNSQSYNAAGAYSVTLTSVSGCDSVATLNLAVNPTLTSTTIVAICSNQLPYSWNSQTYNTAGTYSVTLTSVSGCDSVVTLNLAVNPTKTSTTNVTICSNQLPYSWNSQSYNAAGTYSVTLTSSNGCDSVATLNLSVNPTLTSITNVTICSNQLPYGWNSQSYNAAGNYSVTLTSSNGCDSVATLNLAVNPTLTSTTNVTICSNQLPYNWNSQNYNAAGTYPITLTSVSGCDSVATLNLSVNPTLTSTTSVTVCSNQLPYNWNSQSYNAAGTYLVTLTSTSGCDSVVTLNLSVNPTLTSATNVTICSNQLPYSWNSQSYNAAGTYSVTLTSASGCDSVATLNLSINPTLTSTTNVTICSNQLPYNWNSQSYNAAGTYSVTLTSASGCDSVATLTLAVNPTKTSTTNVTICSNQLPYSWNSQAYNSAGTYSVTLTSASGCDSVAILNLAVNPTKTSTTNVTICSNQLPYNWNSQAYNAAGTYSVTLTSASGCDSVATLNLAVNPILTSTTNITICSNQLPYNWNSQNYNAAGTYPVTLVSVSGCDSVATLNLSVNPILTSTANVTICSNQLPYSWNSQTYNVAGTYSITLISASGCDSIAYLNLTILPNTSSTSAIIICNEFLPFNWNGQNYTSAGTYSVTLTSMNGCDSVATLILTVKPTATSTTNVTICSNQLPYTWNSQNYNAAGTYSVTFVSNSNCDSVATLVLSVNQASTSTSNVSLCNSQLPYIWNSQTYTAAGTYSVTLVSSNGCDSIATLQLSIKPSVNSLTQMGVCDSQLPFTWNGQTYNVPGTYSVTLTSAIGCDSIATLNLTAEALIPGVRYNAISTATNTPVQLQGRPLGVGSSYLWNPSSGLNFNSIKDPIFNYNRTTEYLITIRSLAGCETVDTQLVRVNSPADSIAEVYVPKAWTPNGDGHNDRLFAFTVNVVQLNYFRIFNRWGQLVFESKTMGEGWDGNWRGKPMLSEVYTWTFEGISVKGDVFRKEGISLLLR